MTITLEIIMASLVLGRHARVFVVDDGLSKLKGFSCNKGKIIEVIVRIGNSLNFHREREICSFLQVRIVIVFTSVSI